MGGRGHHPRLLTGGFALLHRTTRPSFSSAPRRSRLLGVRISQQEADLLARCAERHGVTVSEFVRVAIGQVVGPTNDNGRHSPK